MDRSTATRERPSEGAGLEKIVVTAERREESLDKLPIGVMAVTQKTMDDLHIENFTDLASVTPGLIVSTPLADQQDNGDVALRGIFSGRNAPNTQSTSMKHPLRSAPCPAPGRRAARAPRSSELRRTIDGSR